MTQLVVCLLLLATAVAGRHEKYEGHQLYRIGGSVSQLEYLEAKLDILSATPATRSASGHLETLVRISPEERQQWLEYFENNGITYSKIVENLAEILRDEEAMITKSRIAAKRTAFVTKDEEAENSEDESSGDGENDSSSNESDNSSENSSSKSSSIESSSSESSSIESSSSESSSSESSSSESSSEEDKSGWSIRWDTYYRHAEINEFIDELARKYPSLVTVVNAALSYEGRQIKYVRISTSRFEVLRKPVIVIDAAIHAREWITTPVAMYIINQLVVDIVESDLIERLDWVIIPLANPDGYEYSIDEDRLWRKTRSLNHPGSFECPGVDGNRNYDHYWGTTASAANPCSLIYEGPSAFSESEVRVVRDVVNQHLSRAAMYISLHSYGNMFLYAWGNNGSLPTNALSLHLAGIRMGNAIDNLSLQKANNYTVGNAAQVLYYTTGTSRDWTRAVGIPLTYTLELPGYEYDFIVPPTYITQVVTETWAGIVEGAKYVISLYY